jgi:diguanylate cyclase (GGDEF)-like protein
MSSTEDRAQIYPRPTARSPLTPEVIAHLAQEELGMSSVYISRINHINMSIVHAYHDPSTTDFCPIQVGDTFLLSETYCQFVYRSGNPLYVANAEIAQPFAQMNMTKNLHIGSYVGVPLIHRDGSLLGTLCGLHPTPYTIAETQLEMLQMLGHALMLGFERQQLLTELETHREPTMASMRDKLTGLRNRAAFDMALETVAISTAVYNRPYSIIFIDLDCFNQYNETYGQRYGDELLRLVASRLSSELRSEDQLFRYSGEEFVVLLDGIATPGAVKVAERLRRCTRRTCQSNEIGLDGQLIDIHAGTSLTLSLGVATYPSDAATREDVLKRADAAMFQAKYQGRDCVCVANGLSHSAATPNTVDRNESLGLTSIQGMAIRALMAALAARDGTTGEHAHRVPARVESLVRTLGNSPQEVQVATLAALLHDIGKIGIRDAVLQKPGKLTDEEWVEMRQHPEIGLQILQASGGIMALIGQIVVAHHERWDGKGYPRGLQGCEIPLAARAIAVADAYDAMVSDRPYRRGMPEEQAREELRRHAGTQFDPDVVEAFLKILDSETERIAA